MRRVLLLLTGLMGLTASAGTTVEDSIFSGGKYRLYRLYIPSIYNGSSKVPLVFNLHGFNSNALQQQYYGSFMAIADTAGFLVVQPQGTSASPYWNTGLATTPDDVKFLNDLLDSLIATYQVDDDRVYSCGFSNGGVMSYYLACQSFGRFAAIADVAGTMLTNWFFSCKPGRAMPVLKIHGNADNTVPYGGSGLYVAADSVVMKWIRHNSCTVPPVGVAIADTNSADFSHAFRYSYLNGIDGATVEYYVVNNGGHSWPNAPVYIDKTNKDFDGSIEIWKFFRQYRLSQFVTKTGLTENASTPWRVLPDRILTEKPVIYSIFSINGILVDRGRAETEITFTHLLPGCYVIVADGGGITRFVKLPG